MDKPADPRTPLREVYQHFLAVLAKHFRKDTTRAKYLYDFKRFERWLRETSRPVTLASLMDTDILFIYRHHLESLPQQARGSTRQRSDGMLSNKTGPLLSAQHEVPGVVADEESRPPSMSGCC